MTTRYPAYAYKHAVLDSIPASTFDDIQTTGMFDGEGMCLIQRKFSLELSSNEGMTALRNQSCEELSRQRKKSQESAEVQKARKLLEKKGYRVEK